MIPTGLSYSYAIIVFLFAISIGSFLNVCIYRVPENISIMTPGSFCPNCNTPIPFHYNIPVLGYLFLRGRCRFCKIKISMRYPLIECLTGALAVLLFLKFGLTKEMLFWFVFTCVLITISFIDIDHQIIPDVISLPGILIFSLSAFLVPGMGIKDAVFGIITGGGSFTAVALLYYLFRKQEGLGGGDIKLLAMIGAATGIKGVFFTVFWGSVFGTIAGILLILLNKNAGPKLKIPFGPYLSLGALCYIFLGNELIAWYISLLAP